MPYEKPRVKLLAIDTATEACSVSLSIGDGRIDRYVELERGHAERVLPMVESVLAEAGIKLTALDAIAFGRGPGGFTGVRLAASVVQGLAFGAGVGVVPISDLSAVAMRARELRPQARRILVANDARMREVYWAEFLASDLLSPVAGEHVGPPDQVAIANSEAHSEDVWLAAGRGLRAWPDLSARCQIAGAESFDDLLPRASEVLELARPLVAARQVLDPAEAVPVYVRDRVAEPAVIKLT
jgi:tRNA threonylcarbamoyladenosine biosynthesis protein TsaB